jgi:DNA-binding IscR family transcriptional regulator
MERIHWFVLSILDSVSTIEELAVRNGAPRQDFLEVVEELHAAGLVRYLN